MKIHASVVGDLEVNAYIVYEQDGGDAIIIDPGADADRLIAFLGEHKLTLQYILLTHAHYDHIGGAAKLKRATGAKLAVACADAPALTDGILSLAAYSHRDVEPATADILLHDGDTIGDGDLRFTVMATPGHSRGSVCFLGDGVMFSGDTLFFESVGRSDFPGSSVKQLTESLRAIYRLPGDYSVYPGHGAATTLSHERTYNFFLSRFGK